MLLVNKSRFFHYLFSLKIRLEIRFKNVLDRKETFLTIIQSQNTHFTKGVNPCFWSIFSLFVFTQNKSRNKV